MEGLAYLIGLIMLYWLIPITLLILGLVKIKSSPSTAKKLLIASGILFLIGGGICGALLS